MTYDQEGFARILDQAAGCLPPPIQMCGLTNHPLVACVGNSPSTSAASGHVESSSGNGQEMLEDFLGPFPVVRLRGLPFEAQVRDVILFFQVSSGVAHVNTGWEFTSPHVCTFTQHTTTGDRGAGRGDDEQG